jgi:hypothetical protein
MPEQCLLETPADFLQSPGVTFYVVIERRLHRSAVIERPFGDSSLVIVHLRHGTRPDVCAREVFPLLRPHEQLPWRRGFRIPPWPADPVLYVPEDLIAVEENLPAELKLPTELRARGGLYVPYP